MSILATQGRDENAVPKTPGHRGGQMICPYTDRNFTEARPQNNRKSSVLGQSLGSHNLDKFRRRHTRGIRGSGLDSAPPFHSLWQRLKTIARLPSEQPGVHHCGTG